MKKLSYIILSLISLGLWSCQEEPVVCCDAPPETAEVSDLNIFIKHLVGSTPLDFTTEYTLPSMEEVTFRRFSYLLSDFYLVNSDDSKTSMNDQFAYVDVRAGKTTFILSDIPKGNYKGLGFSIGVDSAINHGNTNQYPSDHPLSPINNSLYWSWEGGFIFTALEGKTLANDESFIFHLAGFRNKTNFEFPLSFTKDNPALNATLSYDIAEIFQNPEIYNIANEGASTHSTSDPVTNKLFLNMRDVFSINSISE
ncbi:hypothetical protein OAD66_02350 [Bacteroidia bacterium]|nr:hypothetical protein [Bacteroidia bacterium]